VDEKNPPIPENLSDDLNDFLRLCFEIDHEKRSSARELLNHTWLRKAKEADERNQAASAEKQIMQVEHQTSTDRDGKLNNDT
jgi:serine/threonine protein kinase